MTISLPRSLAELYVADFRTQLPGVRDGDAECIHQARVATRRLREVLPLLIPEDDPMLAIVRTAGRTLGRVRDLDVIAETIARAEARMAVLGLVVARQRIAKTQQRARRKMIKRLEALELDELPAAVAGTAFVRLRERFADGVWKERLRDRIARRADALQHAIHSAGGVYFPKRVHRVRIATKKLRYAAEVAHETRLWRREEMLHDLRRMQTSLGDLHDLQVVVDLLSDMKTDAAPDAGVRDVRSALRAEIAELHRHYVARRDRLQDAAAVCRRFAARRRLRARHLGWPASHVRPLVIASAVLVPAALTLKQLSARKA